MKPHNRYLIALVILLTSTAISSCTTIVLATVDAVGTVASAGIRTAAKVTVATVETTADIAVAGTRASIQLGSAIATAAAAQSARNIEQAAQEEAANQNSYSDANNNQGYVQQNARTYEQEDRYYRDGAAGYNGYDSGEYEDIY